MKLADPTLLKDKCLIDGKWVGDGARPIVNPATGATIAKIPRFGEAETAGAIGAAQKAFGPWAKALPKARAQILRRWFDLIIQNRDDIALIMTSEQGKPLAEALGESITPPPISNSLAKRPSASMARSIRPSAPIRASSSSGSRSAWSRRSRRGIFRPR
jgi:hypothetical protein